MTIALHHVLANVVPDDLVAPPERRFAGSAYSYSRSGDDFHDRFATVHINPFAAGDIESERIQAELMQYGRMNIRDVVRMFDRVESEFIRSAVNDTSSNSTSRKPCTESVGMMISAISLSTG